MTLHHALYVDAGARYVRRFPVLDPLTGTGIDVSGWDGACQIRAAQDETSTLLGEPELTLADGYVELNIPSALSAAWTVREGYYELVLTEPDQEPDRLSQGPVYVNPRTTIPA